MSNAKPICFRLLLHCVRRADGRYRMVYGPEVEWTGSGRRDEDIAALTQHLTSIIEGWVRETPEQWLWLHRRWKTTPSPETPLAQGLRGSAIPSGSPAVPPVLPSAGVQPASVAPPLPSASVSPSPEEPR